MAHLHYIIIDNKSGESLYDSWCELIIFETEYDAQIYLEDNELEKTHHIETWLAY